MMKDFFYKYWWLFYLLLFLLIGGLIYALFLHKNTGFLNDRMTLVDQRLTECCRDTVPNPPPIPPQDTIDSIPPPAPPPPRPVQPKRGCLSFELKWSTADDLDLHVIDPQMREIYYGNRRAGNGELDIDKNRSASEPDPIENVYYNCPITPGVYTAKVVLFSKRHNAPTAYKLFVREGQKIVKIVEGSIANNKQTNIIISYRYEAQ